MPTMPLMLLNGALYSLGWFACVALRNWISALVFVAVLAAYFYVEKQRYRAIVLLAVATLIGFSVDNALYREGVLIPVDAGNVTPLWMTALWPLFATTFNIAFRPLQDSPVFAALLAAVVAPLTYLAAVQMGAAKFGVLTELALACIAFIWLLLFPIGLRFTRQLMVSNAVAGGKK